MYNACHQYFNDANVMIAAAAVADYRPKNVALQKIKKNEATFTIELEKPKIFYHHWVKLRKSSFL